MFQLYTNEQLRVFLTEREAEVKLGELLTASAVQDSVEAMLTASTAKFVILGIPEDIGVRANLGVGGAETAWNAFLKAFLNIQFNAFLKGHDILVLGAFDFGAQIEKSHELNPYRHADLVQLRSLVAEMDEQIAPIIATIAAHGKIPIVIGGGHNNAFPIIKGVSLGLEKSINTLNLDAHADFRREKGRHSGNGFRAAFQRDFLKKYAILGLHENYAPDYMLSDLQNERIEFITFEDIFVRQTCTWQQALQQALAFVNEQHFGVELDLDAIENTTSSAMSPCGVSAIQARQFVHQAGSSAHVAYLHLCEGAAQLANGISSATIGKLLSYLVTDFIKAYSAHPH